MATKRQRRKRRQRTADSGPQASSKSARPDSREAISAGTGNAGTGEISPTREPGRAPRRPRQDGPPPAPWGSFPLTELVVLVALVMLVLGFVVPPPRGAVLLGAGLALGSLAGLELAIREHFAGYKSHTALLAGAIGIPVVAGLYFLGPESLPIWVSLLAGILAFAGAAWFFAGVFRRRSGGELFKFRA